MTYRSTPLVMLWYLSALVFFVGVGFIDSSQAMLGTEMRELIPAIPVIWGTLGLLSLAAEMLGVALDARFLTRSAAAMYVTLWVFAGTVYIIGGHYVLFFAVSLPHLLFWAWNFAVRYDHERIVRETKYIFSLRLLKKKKQST